MKKLYCIYAFCLLIIASNSALANTDKDWMIDGSSYRASVVEQGDNIILSPNFRKVIQNACHK